MNTSLPSIALFIKKLSYGYSTDNLPWYLQIVSLYEHSILTGDCPDGTFVCLSTKYILDHCFELGNVPEDL